MLKIGVVGYSDKKFDKEKARMLLTEAIDEAIKNTQEEIAIVSGLTDIGIPAIAYRIAQERKYFTVGIACEKAYDFKLFKVDEEIIVGKDWGEESPTFLKYIDCLIRIGGGEQSLKETALAKRIGISVIEKELEINLE